MTHDSGTLQPDAVRGMFDRIAPVYDAMNHVMTAGLDRSWRRLTVEVVVQPGDRVLDACCGTGDLAVAAEKSRPVTAAPRRPAATARSPVPQHASRTRSPGRTTASTVSLRHLRSSPAVITRFITS